MPNWVVLLAYQAAWIGCVAGGARGLTWPGVLSALLVFGLAGAQVGPRARRARIALACAACGILCDLGLAAAGLLTFPTPAAALGPLPVWMACLWLSFAPCVPILARWLGTRPLLAVALGAAGGPLAYLSASRMGAVRLEGAAAWVAVAAEFAVIAAVSTRYAHRALHARRTAP